MEICMIVFGAIIIALEIFDKMIYCRNEKWFYTISPITFFIGIGTLLLGIISIIE